jgi:HAE1 family hydrophobic/amphiphilic exporter-1
MSWSDLPLDRPVATVSLLVSLMVLGTVGFVLLPLDFFPVVKEPEIEVTVPFPGSHPLEALNQVARPIEEEIATIHDLEGIFTWVSEGQVFVEAEFEWSSQIDLKRTEVREAVDRARPRLPEGIGHIRVEGDMDGPGGGAVLWGRVSATRNLSESWDLLDKRIKRPLERVRGVARVDLDGVEPQEVRIDLDLEALRRHGIQPAELLTRLDRANLDMDLGAIRGDVLRYNVRSLGRFREIDTIRDLSLGPGDVRVRDVASVSLEEPRLTYGRHLDRSFAIGLEVFKEPTANTVDTCDRVLAQIERIKHDPQLRGIELLVWNNAGEQILNSIRGLRNAGIFGGLLAISVLYFFLRRWRTTAIVAVAIPFSLLVTCGVMYLIGIDLNVLSMLGLMLGVGMLVDNAVVVIENIHRLQASGMGAKDAARLGSKQVALAVLASTATTIIVWSWLFVSERSGMTIYMGIFAGVICIAVTGSLVISLTFIPLAAARFPPHREVRPGFMLRRVLPAYRRLLGLTLRHRVATLLFLLVIAASTAIPLALIEKSGDTREQEQDVPIIYQIHDPVEKDIIEGYVDQVEAWLEERRDQLRYDKLYSWFQEPNHAQTRVFLASDDRSPARVKELRRMLQDELPTIPGVTLEVGERDWWRHGGDSGKRMISVALHGDDPEFLEEMAIEAEERLRAVPEVVDVWGPSVSGQEEVRLIVDSERAMALGVTPRAVAETVGLAFRGRHLRRFKGAESEVEIVLGLPEEQQPGLAALADLPVPRADREPVPLSSVATIELSKTMPQLMRIDRQTTTHVSVQFDEEEVTTEEGYELVRGGLEGFRLPEGYAWDFGRRGRDHDEALGVMARGVSLALIVVIMLMAALFESLSQPLAIIITLPSAFFGALWGLWLGGFDLDVLAFIGVILLIGIVVNNGIVMVDHVNTLRREGRTRVDALIEGCGDRLRPVLMTAITTFFGLMPLAFSAFTVAEIYVDSMAVAIIGGLATSTIFTLIGLPVWYSTVEDIGSTLISLLPRRHGTSRLPRPRGGVLVKPTGSGESSRMP